MVAERKLVWYRGSAETESTVAMEIVCRLSDDVFVFDYERAAFSH